MLLHVYQFSVIHILVIVRAAAISLNPGQLQYINYRYHSVSIWAAKIRSQGTISMCIQDLPKTNQLHGNYSRLFKRWAKQHEQIQLQPGAVLLVHI